MSEGFMAWVDESGSKRAQDPGTYLLSAAITTEHQAEEARAKMESLLLPGQVKLHWRDEQRPRQRLIARTIAELDVEHLVVVTTPHPESHNFERRRRLTMKHLLPELEALGVSRATFESRGRADDQRDRRMLDTLRADRSMGSLLRIQHQPGRSDPVLWVPDALCGIVTEMRCGDLELWELVQAKVTLREISP